MIPRVIKRRNPYVCFSFLVDLEKQVVIKYKN